jgi:CMP-N,N'-diacetyllegionaminic acid synthase
MHKGKTYLAIIPARGESKRLPRKNLLDLNGKPLVAWSIEAGLNSKYIDKVVVTSDDADILNIAKYYGVLSINRPIELSSDTATTFDAVEHAIENIKYYDYIVLLQPTSPLRTEWHIDKAIEFLINKEADAIVSVCEMDHSPLWSNTLDDTLSMAEFLTKSIKNKRSQDLDSYYRINGAIYICDTKKLLKEKGFFIENGIYAFKMDRETSIDIDNEIDFHLVDLILKSKGVSL